MLERTTANISTSAKTFIADAGHWGEDQAKGFTEAKTDLHIATDRQKTANRHWPQKAAVETSWMAKGEWPARSAPRKGVRFTPRAR